MSQILDIFLHLDVHLNALAVSMGPGLYVLLFAIIFCETGLIVMPFLPGDSLLFAVGALAAIDGSPLNVWVLMPLLFVAALLGDTVNYATGYHLGPRVFAREDSWLLHKKHLLKTQGFYERHGGKTIILARFMPIVRTFAPFVAGIGKMSLDRYATFCVVGAATWVSSFLLAGYWMGNQPAIKQNFHIVILAIIVISVMPGVFEFIRAKRASRGVQKSPAM